MPKIKAHATPTKEFFVRMITKDIDLIDCILDLVDNSLDGARRSSANLTEPSERYSGYRCEIVLSNDAFTITDNCGGITVDQAKNYAFHFGRRKDARTGDQSIGLYGIGMKRAIFKLGNDITIESSTSTESFTTRINVDEWLNRPSITIDAETEIEDWDFDLETHAPKTGAGTIIRVQALHEDVARQFSDPTIVTKLSRIISR